MTRMLMILRHAKSSWDSDAPTDFERPLGPRGERDAPRMGAWLKERKLKPKHVVSSPAERALQTTAAVCEVLGVKKNAIHLDQRIYGSDVDTLLQVLSSVPRKAKRVMLVGHNPGLEELLIHLWGEEVQIPANGKLLPTAAVALVALPDSWNDLAVGSALSVKVIRPKEID